MKSKMTLHEIYYKLKDINEQRNMLAKCLASSVIENDSEGIIESFKKSYQHMEEVLEYYSTIEVEFDNKYAGEENEDE